MGWRLTPPAFRLSTRCCGRFDRLREIFPTFAVLFGRDRLFLGQIFTTAGGGEFALVQGMISIHRILVATDFGLASESALQYGRELARSFGADLHVLHVTENLFARAVDAYSYVPLELQQELEVESQKQTEALLDDEDRRELHAIAATVTSNTPADTIVEYARDHHIGLIVVGTHGHGMVAHLFLGSVAEHVVRTAPCPVLTVRNPEQEFVFPDALVLAERTAATAPRN
jgi:nucleotide-binding universal stress UspA family protein